MSFNWDILLEVAFRKAGKEYTYVPTKSSSTDTLYLRPHGCIAWFALLDRELLSIDLNANLSVFGNDLKYYMLCLKDPLGNPDMGNSNEFAKLALSPVAAIVPPTSKKLLSVGSRVRDTWVENGHDEAMQAVWRAFQDAVTAAEEIVVIGYSLPGTDTNAVEIFKAASRTPKQVFIVDPDPLGRIVERYRRILSPNVTKVCEDFKRFDPLLLS